MNLHITKWASCRMEFEDVKPEASHLGEISKVRKLLSWAPPSSSVSEVLMLMEQQEALGLAQDWWGASQQQRDCVGLVL